MSISGTVLICTPTDTHSGLIEAATAMVAFCEKPLDLSLTHAQARLGGHPVDGEAVEQTADRFRTLAQVWDQARVGA